jgi:ABC-type multidrug transport system ATPase subunit
VSLLTFAHATKRFTTGQRETVALRDVTLDLDAGECVAVYGMRRSGRTTLLRVAAGLLPVDGGEVRFDGRDLARGCAGTLGVEIGYCNPDFDPAQGGSVADHVAVALLARGTGRLRARALADEALARAGVASCANLDPRELHHDELVRAGIARALVTAPRLLLLDEPTNGVDVLERDGILELLRAFADDGAAILMTVGEPVAGADRVLALDGGELRGHAVPEPAPVVPLRRHQVGPTA